jgi:hypothetical protein
VDLLPFGAKALVEGSVRKKENPINRPTWRIYGIMSSYRLIYDKAAEKLSWRENITILW